MCDRIIGPHIFENAESFTEMKKDIDTRSIHTFLRPVVIQLRNSHELWFQQDGATCHTSNETTDVLQEMFGNNIISRLAAQTELPMLQITIFGDI